jgi:hypothetical protein
LEEPVPLHSLLITLLFGAGLVASSSHALAYGKCEALFVSEKSAALVYPYQDPVVQLRDTDSVFLGDGAYGKVVLERDPFNSARLQARKTYGTRRGATAQAQADAYVMGQLRRIRQSGSTTGFDFIQLDVSITTEVDGSTMVAAIGPFVTGRSVHDLMTDPAIDHKLKPRVAEVYSDYILGLTQEIQLSEASDGSLSLKAPDASIYFKDQRADGQLALFGQFKNAGRLGKFIIKSDNVQVDPYNIHHMTVVDGY